MKPIKNTVTAPAMTWEEYEREFEKFPGATHWLPFARCKNPEAIPARVRRVKPPAKATRRADGYRYFTDARR